MKVLSIQIPTVVGREEQFEKLYNHLMDQIRQWKLENLVEVIYLRDNKEMTIGAKRQKLYEMADALYSVQIDDDDWVPADFCRTLVEFAKHDADVISYIEECKHNGRSNGKSIFSKNYKDWVEKLSPSVYGCVRARTPFFKSPIKTELCRKVGVADMRFGEDHDFSRRMLPHLKTQSFIMKTMYYYHYQTEGTHNERYGIK